MTDVESRSSGRQESKGSTAVTELLETARRQYSAGHYGIALTALEQAAKKMPDDESLALAMAYLRTNMVALKAKDAGMPVQTPEPPPFFHDEVSAAKEDRTEPGPEADSTVELEADLPDDSQARQGSFLPEEESPRRSLSSVEIEAMVPETSEQSDASSLEFGQQDVSGRDGRGSSLELEALPPEDSEEIELEPFKKIEDEGNPDQGENESIHSDVPSIAAPALANEDDDFFSQEDLDLLASDDNPVEAMDLSMGASEKSMDGTDTEKDRSVFDGFSEDAPTIAKTPQQGAMPAAFAGAVAQAMENRSAGRTTAQAVQSNVVFDGDPARVPMAPSSMTITGMPLPDFVKEQGAEPGATAAPEEKQTNQEIGDNETGIDIEERFHADSDSFDEAPTVARDHLVPSTQADEEPTIARVQVQPDSDSFDEALTITRQHAPAERDSFDEEPTIARTGLSGQTSNLGDRAPTMMLSPKGASAATVEGQDLPAADEKPGVNDEQRRVLGAQNPLLAVDRDSLSLETSDVPGGLFSDAPTIERDTWRRKHDQQRPRPQDILDEAKELFERGEHTKSLELCKRVAPVLEGSKELDLLISENEEILTSRYIVQLGGLDAVPIVTFEGQDLQALGMDHRKAFLLTRIDGELTLDEVLMISGMSRLETARTLMELKLAGLLEINRIDADS